MTDRKEYLRKYMKEYHIKNKAKLLELKKEYRDNNKEWISEKNKEYNKTPKGLKVNSISRWKSRGVIHEDFDKLYELYINTDECMVCHNPFKNSKDRHLDHSHITGEYRNVLCQSCNSMDSWKNKI